MGNLFDGRKQTVTSPNAIRGDLRAYNPFVIDSSSQGASTAWIMLTRTDSVPGDFAIAQTGWLKTPNYNSPDKYNPLVFYQVIDSPNAPTTVFKSGPEVVNPPYMHTYQLNTNGDGYWSFDFNGVEWGHIDANHPNSWSNPNQLQTYGEVFNYYYEKPNRGDQMAGDRLSLSKMKFRNLEWAPDLTGSWRATALGTATSDQPWFKKYSINGSNFDIWDERCPN